MSKLFQQWSPQDGQPPSADFVQLAPRYARRGAIAVIGQEIVSPVMRTKLAIPGTSFGWAGMLSGPGGRALATDGGAGSRFDLGKVPKALVGTTWIVQFSTFGTSGPDYASSTVNTGSSYIEDILLNSTGEASSSGALEFLIRDDTGLIKRCATAASNINDGRVHTVVWTLTDTASGSVGVSCWLDGFEKTLIYDRTDALSGLASNDTEFPVWLFTRNLRGTGSGGSDATQRIYLYARLPDAPLASGESLSRDPWQIFEAIEQPFWISTTTAYTLTASAGSFTLTGVAAGLRKDSILRASVGAFTLTGIDATLVYTPVTNYTLVADVGNFTLTGVNASLRVDRVMPAAVGTFTLTGINATLKRGYYLGAGTGSFSLTGVASNLLWNHVMPASVGTFTLTGKNATLIYSGSGGGVPVTFYRGVSKSPKEGEGVSLPIHTLTPAGGSNYTINTDGSVSRDLTSSPNYEGYDYS